MIGIGPFTFSKNNSNIKVRRGKDCWISGPAIGDEESRKDGWTGTFRRRVKT